jgi:cytochrome b6-f complex iron-sulfur subunit
MERRRFLMGLSGAAMGLLVGEGLYASVRYLAPWGQVREAKPVPVPLAQIPPGKDLKVQYGSDTVHLFNREGKFVAFNLACTHLQCLVIWNPEKQQFDCPCHDGHFDAEGKPISGPPPLPLEQVPVTVEGETVIVGA